MVPAMTAREEISAAAPRNATTGGRDAAGEAIAPARRAAGARAAGAASGAAGLTAAAGPWIAAHPESVGVVAATNVGPAAEAAATPRGLEEAVADGHRGPTTGRAASTRTPG
jgi:hypothetical protein